MTDHPRSCGANTFDTAKTAVTDGSSPLVRGQHCQPFPKPHRSRIIPARAGPTKLYGPIIGAIPDHPRSCGANTRVIIHAEEGDGSSPLVRGQLASPAFSAASSRIIPARAGPTAKYYLKPDITADHPRSCGANRTVSHS